jgi:plasmid stability protein
MPVLHVRNVPDKLYTSLQHRAETQRRSLSAEVITLLEWAVKETERSSEIPLASIRRRRFFEPAAAGIPDSTTLLRQDRDR